MSAAVRVVVVEDSPVQRAHLVEVLGAEHDIAAVGQAGDPVEAVALVHRLRPDVVTMDLGLPGEGGIGAIEQIMTELPTPILVLSARVTCAGSAAAVESLLAGAVEALPKPERWDARPNARSAAGCACSAGSRWSPTPADAGRPPPTPTAPRRWRSPPRPGARPPWPRSCPALAAWPCRCWSSSTGTRSWSTASSAGCSGCRPCRWWWPPTATARSRAWSTSPPAGAHLRLAPAPGVPVLPAGPPRTLPAGGRRLVLDPGPASLHRPSADELFGSVAATAGGQSVGVLLTGMGDDGAAGLLAVRRQGAVTIVQDEASSVVFGMPRAAQELGAAAEVLGLGQIHGGIRNAVARLVR